MSTLSYCTVTRTLQSPNKSLHHHQMLRFVGISLRQRAHLSCLAPTIGEIFTHPPKVDSQVIARGHIKSIRSFKNIGFIDISDGSSFLTLNVVFLDPDHVFEQSKFKVGQSVVVKGKWIESQGKQNYELQYDRNDPSHEILVLGDVPDNYAIQKKHQTLQYLRGVPTLRHRTGTLASVMRFRSNVELAIMKYFSTNDFVKVSPPMVTSSDCEGAGEMFVVTPLNNNSKEVNEKFFGKDAYLTVSTQLHLEVLALSLNRVWSLSPCFRAEDSNTNRHLSEFWMLEAEMCYIEKVHQLTDFVENMIRLVVQHIQDDTSQYKLGGVEDLHKSRYSKEEVDKMTTRWNTILSEKPWPSITYTEAIDLINKIKNKGRLKGRVAWGDSILTEHEKWLAGSHFQSPVFITDYPADQKPFYMPPSDASVFDPERPTVACFDLVVPDIGELIGGSVREHRYEPLVAEIEKRGMVAETLDWYLSTRTNGSVPHGGFGMGFERLIAYLAAMENIKDVTAFPRAPQVCAC